MRRATWALLVAALAVSAAASCTDGNSVPAASDAGAKDGGVPGDSGAIACRGCFGVESLEPAVAEEAKEILLTGLDNEALHTLVGDTRAFAVIRSEPADPARTAKLESIAQSFACTDRLTAFVRTIGAPPRLELLVVRASTLRRVIDVHAELFATLGATTDSPKALLDRVENAPPAERARALSLLFGEPDEAADFAAARATDDADAADGGAADFEVRLLPTWTNPQGGVSYRVAKGTALSAPERSLFEAAREVVVAYDIKRTNFIGPIGEGSPALIRTFLANDDGLCAPESAATSVTRSRAKHGACLSSVFDCTRAFECCSLRCESSHCQ